MSYFWQILFNKTIPSEMDLMVETRRGNVAAQSHLGDDEGLGGPCGAGAVRLEGD